ncbi:MerR family transcriptional regulator [Xanthobacteraceae bacterium Astr-EGSB]|uniref:MerR family transcriptional regulator n=1 Tax=Astrobacterium formosum TaxID=3069710 RepID=UPI0027AEE0ED|nr:MerR family transcriptional regulator [Xanthobacteraceae bacterium Astr-EGSB]
MCADTSGSQYFSIGQLANEFGITLRTVRFYEQRGLINPIRNGSARQYSDADRTKLMNIVQARKLGFSVQEIVDLMPAKSESGPNSGLLLSREQIVAQIDYLQQQTNQIELALAELRKFIAALDAKREAPEAEPAG